MEVEHREAGDAELRREHSELPIESRQMRRSRSGEGPAARGGRVVVRGPSRSTRPPTTAPARHATPDRRERPSRHRRHDRRQRRAPSRKPLSGIAVWRIAEREPALLGGNQCITARPLADWTLAPVSPGEREQAGERPEAVHEAGARSARRRRAPRPVTSTSRSPTRSVARPHGSRLTTRPDERAREQRARSARATGGRGRAARAPSRRRRTRSPSTSSARTSPPRGRPSGSASV